MTDAVPSKVWPSSHSAKLAKALIGALFLGWFTDASTAEMMLMFMVLHLHLDIYYG